MIAKSLVALLAVATLTGCSVYREATASTLITSVNWREVVTTADRERLRNWRKAWNESLPAARAANPGAIAADPELYDPDRALADPALPPGAYRCRTYKLGAQGAGNRAYTPYPWFECRVTDEGEVFSLHKLTGSQRPTGLVFRDTPTRAIFLGTLVLGDENSPLRYGIDATRDMAGYVDRIGPKRWRLVFPYPRFESLLDVTEIVPAG